MDWFLDPIREHYVDFQGRVSRKAYWMFTLYYVIFSIAIAVVEQIIGVYILGTIVTLALFLPALGLAFRRLHDVNKSAWWLLFTFIPLVGWLVPLYFAIQPGDKGDNQYGTDPLTGNNPEAAPVTVNETPQNQPTSETSASSMTPPSESV